MFLPQTPQFYMDLALKKAWEFQLLTYPNPAVGACVVGKHGEILALRAHEKAGSAHAEVLALQDAYFVLSGDKALQTVQNPLEIHNFLYENHQNLFHDCTIYVTLEPCNHHGKTPPCALLLEKVGIKKVFISCLDKSAAAGGLQRLENAGSFCQSGILANEGRDLLAPFISWQAKKPFIFFKYAQTINGAYQGGIISNRASRKHVHKLRSVIDQLVIGGETVRVDRPTLDTRLIEGTYQPDILIISREKEFDHTIPLFSIKKREVKISSDLSLIRDKAFSMIEGGSAGFSLFKDQIDWLLIYVSGTMASQKNFHASFDGEVMHIEKIEDNYLFWIKRKECE